jgi:hypothetical protein
MTCALVFLIETRSFINNDVLVKFYGVFEFSI